MSGAEESRADYRHFVTISTRWMDNDVYGHVNNVQYYSYFDTAVNSFLIQSGNLDIEKSAVIGMVVETMCRYKQSLSFPGAVEVGLRVAHIGNSSVRYEIGVFGQGKDRPSASGHFVHVYVGRESRRPVSLPEGLRQALHRLLV